MQSASKGVDAASHHSSFGAEGQFSCIPPAYTMLVGPHIAEIHSSRKEDDPEGQQDQEAVTHGHHTLIVSVPGGVW